MNLHPRHWLDPVPVKHPELFRWSAYFGTASAFVLLAILLYYVAHCGEHLSIVVALIISVPPGLYVLTLANLTESYNRAGRWWAK